MLPISSISLILFKILPLNIIPVFCDHLDRARELLLALIKLISLLLILFDLFLLIPYIVLSTVKCKYIKILTFSLVLLLIVISCIDPDSILHSTLLGTISL